MNVGRRFLSMGLLGGALLLPIVSFGQGTTALPQTEKTSFQTGAPWKASTDVRSDVVICYNTTARPGITFEQRVQSWRDRGYRTHFMTGIAWGEYQDYFSGAWDGKPHFDEGQREQSGDTIWHNKGVIPYIVPTKNFLEYIKQTRIKRVIDAGIDAIYLEEPEFWARGGYSEAFKREWKDYYGFDWRPQDASAENTYLSNKLKYHLYYRALQEVFTYAKEYGRQKGMEVRCYVPTHSLLNYSQWQIVSPEASLASLPCVDGYIAQVWTGTSRVPNYFNGKMRERVFETAFLEYGCMRSMTAPTGRTMYFLTDPIEDAVRDWQDYKRNYEATFTAELMYPEVDRFEVMPWPERIYEGLYRKSMDSEEMIHIPRFYSTQMQVMINALNFMPQTENRVSGTQGICVLMSNSLMFQRTPEPLNGYDDPQLSNFLGEALPLLKRGVPVHILHIENVSYPDTWKETKILLMSYSNMKPMDPTAHRSIADWVKQGGILIYSGRDDDPFQSVQEWWNSDGNSYRAPSEHLFELMGLPKDAAAGSYVCGKGKVYVIREDPKAFVMQSGGDAKLLQTVEQACEHDLLMGAPQYKNSLYLERGMYDLVSVMDEDAVSSEPFVVRGDLIDLFDPQLPVVKEKIVRPGSQAFLIDLSRIPDPSKPQVLAAASRQYEEQRDDSSYAFVSKSPANTTNVMRILLPKAAKKITVTDSEGRDVAFQSSWDAATRTALLQFENSPEGIKVFLRW